MDDDEAPNGLLRRFERTLCCIGRRLCHGSKLGRNVVLTLWGNMYIESIAMLKVGCYYFQEIGSDDQIKPAMHYML